MTARAEALLARWASHPQSVMTAHLVASLQGISVRAARRVIAQLMKAGQVGVYGRNLSGGKTLYGLAETVAKYQPAPVDGEE